jgi:hypothetical protein
VGNDPVNFIDPSGKQTDAKEGTDEDQNVDHGISLDIGGCVGAVGVGCASLGIAISEGGPFGLPDVGIIITGELGVGLIAEVDAMATVFDGNLAQQTGESTRVTVASEPVAITVTASNEASSPANFGIADESIAKVPVISSVVESTGTDISAISVGGAAGAGGSITQSRGLSISSRGIGLNGRQVVDTESLAKRGKRH